MSQHQEPDPQEWRTYPHGPQPEPGHSDASGRQDAYADPPAPQQGAPGSYSNYPAYPPAPGTDHNQTYPYQQAPQQKPSARLNQTWVWIIIGIVASFVIFNVIDGRGWSVFLFVGIAWWLWSRNRRC